MRKRLLMGMAMALAVALPAHAETKLHVVARYDGVPPQPKKIDTDADPYCSKFPQVEQGIVVKDGALANVMVRVKGGPKTAAPKKPVVLEQQGCAFRPRVVGAVVGQAVTVRSFDDTSHDIHAFRSGKALFDHTQSKGEMTRPGSDFPATAGPVTFKCDLHPWMTGYVYFNENSWFAVTGSDGTATLSLPPGKYTIEAWQPVISTQTQDVEITDNAPPDLTFHFHSGSGR